jgi:hypothetical protein
MDKPTSTEPAQGLIIVRLLGGLGNQMFQYAMGRSLSIIHRRPLKFDLGFYSSAAAAASWAPRFYGLSHFSLSAEIATDTETAPFKKYLGQNFFSKAARRLSGFGNYYLRSYILEPRGNNFVFDPRLLTARLKPIVYLDGFWQTEKYFAGIEKIIRDDFTLSGAPDSTNQAMLLDIGSGNSVAIHIRHGDNATKIAHHHGVLPVSYYDRAVKILAAKVQNPNFYIFSDDPSWAKENLKLDFPSTFVTHNADEKNYEDLRLMSACKHHIIGNSTFSWWGAWLGKKPGQMVLAPDRYHVNTTIQTGDLYPQAWQLVKV